VYGSQRGTGFLADSSGLVLTNALILGVGASSKFVVTSYSTSSIPLHGPRLRMGLPQVWLTPDL